MNEDYNERYGQYEPERQEQNSYHYSYTPQSSFPELSPAPKKEKRNREKKGWTGGKIVALALCCALLGGAMGFGGSLLANSLRKSEPVPASSTISNVLMGERETSELSVHPVDTSKVMTAAEVYAANVDSTVGITTSINTNYFGYQTTAAASGSGFILTDDGYILTNFHVVESSVSITVTTYDGESYEASLVGYDESNDIAVLKIDGKDLKPVVIGSSDKLNVGDDVVAIGNPLGELTFSLTKGAVSALDRQITLSTGSTMNLIQTDCAINSGNSGGALFNLYGEVVGITNAKYSSSGYSSEASIDNIGFAIPIDSVYDIVESIIEKGYISKSYIGVSVGSVDEQYQAYGLPAGASVQSVTEDGPADEAGIQKNDIITKWGDTEIKNQNDLVTAVRASAVGDEVKVTVYRQGKTIELTVTVGETIQDAIEEKEETSGEEQSQQSQQSQQGQQGQSVIPFFPFNPWG